jgi:diacylglycerol O-acyltransferase / wax synthase
VEGRADESRISPIDAATLGLSVHGGQPYLIVLGGMLEPGGFIDASGRPDVAGLRAILEPRVARLPVMTHRPVGRGDDWWWEPGEPDLALHVREEAPEPGDRGFEAVCARLVMQPLPPDRPLWDLVLVPGARPRRCGIVVRFHHLLADGAHAVDLIERLSDPGPAEPADAAGASDAAAPAPPASPEPPAQPGSPALSQSRLAVIAFRLRQFIRPPIRSRTLLGPLGPHRDVAGTSVDFEEAHRRAHEAGGTVGDAFLAAVGSGLRHVLESAGDPVPTTLTVSEPVRLGGGAGQRNAVGVMLVDVPVRDDDLRAAIARIARTTRSAKPIARAAGTVIRSSAAARGFDAFARRQRLIAAVVSNVPGPRSRLAIAGARLAEVLPLSPLAGNVRVGVTVVSYDGRLWLGVQADADHVAPAAGIAEAIADALGGRGW